MFAISNQEIHDFGYIVIPHLSDLDKYNFIMRLFIMENMTELLPKIIHLMNGDVIIATIDPFTSELYIVANYPVKIIHDRIYTDEGVERMLGFAKWSFLSNDVKFNIPSIHILNICSLNPDFYQRYMEIVKSWTASDIPKDDTPGLLLESKSQKYLH